MIEEDMKSASNILHYENLIYINFDVMFRKRFLRLRHLVRNFRSSFLYYFSIIYLGSGALPRTK